MFERAISVVKDYKLLEIADQHREGAVFVSKQLIETIDPAQFENLPIKIYRADEQITIGYVHNVRKTEEWFIADLKLMLDADIYFELSEDKVQKVLSVIMTMKGFGP